MLAAAGVPGDRIRFRYGLDARYLGQGNELTIWVGDGDQWPVTDDQVVERFESDYRRIYGLTIPDVAVEAVTWRLSAYANADTVEPVADVGDRARPTAHGARRSLRTLRRPQSTRRSTGAATSAAGSGSIGPAIVEERETTAVIRPGWTVEVADDGSLVAERSTLMALRSDRARGAVAEPDRHGQRAGQGAAAGGLLAHRPRSRRPGQRRVRPARPDGRPGGHRHARTHQLAGPRRDRGPRGVPPGVPGRGRRADHQRPVQDRRSAARRDGAVPGVPRRQGDRLLRFDDPPHRRRRLRHRRRRARRVRGRPVDPDLQADERRRAQRRRVAVHPQQRAPARPHVGRPARPDGLR